MAVKSLIVDMCSHNFKSENNNSIISLIHAIIALARVSGQSEILIRLYRVNRVRFESVTIVGSAPLTLNSSLASLGLFTPSLYHYFHSLDC